MPPPRCVQIRGWHSVEKERPCAGCLGPRPLHDPPAHPPPTPRPGRRAVIVKTLGSVKLNSVKTNKWVVVLLNCSMSNNVCLLLFLTVCSHGALCSAAPVTTWRNVPLNTPDGPTTPTAFTAARQVTTLDPPPPPGGVVVQDWDSDQWLFPLAPRSARSGGSARLPLNSVTTTQGSSEVSTQEETRVATTPGEDPAQEEVVVSSVSSDGQVSKSYHNNNTLKPPGLLIQLWVGNVSVSTPGRNRDGGGDGSLGKEGGNGSVTPLTREGSDGNTTWRNVNDDDDPGVVPATAGEGATRQQEEYTSPTSFNDVDNVTGGDNDVIDSHNANFEAQTVDSQTGLLVGDDQTGGVTLPEVVPTPEAGGDEANEVTEALPFDEGGWYHSSPSPQHGGDGDDAASSRLTTMFIVVRKTIQAPTKWSGIPVPPPRGGGIDIHAPDADDDRYRKRNHTAGGDVDDLQYELKDLILAVCGTAASTFTLCMLVTFTRCCCKKQKDDSDGEDPSKCGRPPSAPSAANRKSLWKRSWKRPLDSAATTGTQESSVSENITQVTIERRESYGDDREESDGLSDGYEDDDDEGGFTKGRRRQRNGDTGKSRKSHAKDSDDNGGAPASVKDRIRAFEVPIPGHHQSQGHGEVKVREGTKPRKNKPTSKAFSEFESKGILIGFGGPRRRHDDDEDDDRGRDGVCDSPLGVLLPSPTSGSHSLEDTPTSSRGLEDDEGVHTMESEEDEFAAIQRNGEVLKSFRRAPPPRNRNRARKSGRGRRSMRGQDVSSSEQIAEEPSSGSFGSRPTSGINSPATSATPEEEEHDSFEASLHMTTESLSVARSSSISQTPQSSLDSMDSPKRQASVSSRESPLRGSVGDSPKRLLDSPKRQLRESPRRTPPLSQRSPSNLRRHGEARESGPADFNLTIPVEFQQQRLGGGAQSKHDKVVRDKNRRPMSYHVDPIAAPSRGGSVADKFRPLRPVSTHVHPIHTESDSPLTRDMWPPEPSLPSTKNGHEAIARPHTQTHLHEHIPCDQAYLHEPRPRDSMSLSHGHLARKPGSPVGRVMPQIRQSASPGELRRWESEHSYLQEEGRKPSKLRKDGGVRGRGVEKDEQSPDGPPSSSRSRQTLRPMPEDGQVKEHPQSEKLERKALETKPTTAGSTQTPQHLIESGGTGVQISEKAPGQQCFDAPPPRPPLPSWRRMKPVTYNGSDQFPLPLTSTDADGHAWNGYGRPKPNLRSKSFHVRDPRERQPRSENYRRTQEFRASDQMHGHVYDITPEDLRRTWDGIARSRSLERPIKWANAYFTPEPYRQGHHSLDKYGSLDISPDQIRAHQRFSDNHGVTKSKSLEMSPSRLVNHYQWRNIEPELEPSYDEVDYDDMGMLFRPLPSRKSWHGSTKTPERLQPETKSALGKVPWLRMKDNEESENLKPSQIRKSMQEPTRKPSSMGASEVEASRTNNASIDGHPMSSSDDITPSHLLHRSRKTEEFVAKISLDFNRNMPQSQSARLSRSPPEQSPLKADMRYSSMRERPQNWRNGFAEKKLQYVPSTSKKRASNLHTSSSRSPMSPADPLAPAAALSLANVSMLNSVMHHQTNLEEPVPPPRPPLPSSQTLPYKPNYLPTHYNVNESGEPVRTISPPAIITRAPWHQQQSDRMEPNQHQGSPQNTSRHQYLSVPPIDSHESLPISDMLPQFRPREENYIRQSHTPASVQQVVRAVSQQVVSSHVPTTTVFLNHPNRDNSGAQLNFKPREEISVRHSPASAQQVVRVASQDTINSIAANIQAPVMVMHPSRDGYWSMDRPGVKKQHIQQQLPPHDGYSNPEFDEPRWRPDVIDQSNLRHVSHNEQRQPQCTIDERKHGSYSEKERPGPHDHSMKEWAIQHGEHSLKERPASYDHIMKDNYIDMTQGVQCAEVTPSPLRLITPSTQQDQVSITSAPSIFSEPSPEPGQVPHKDRVLRFTRDPRWKDALVKPEPKSMYEVMQSHDQQFPHGYPYKFTPEDSSPEVKTTTLLRDAPDVVPMSERRISPRITTPDNELRFRFNFDVEATEI